MIQYTFNIRPMPKPRMVKSDTWKKRPCVLRYWAYKDELVLMANLMNFKQSNAFEVEFIFSGGPSGEPHQKKPDLDNLVKALVDCLWVNDETVFATTATKTFGKTDKIIVTCY